MSGTESIRITDMRERVEATPFEFRRLQLEKAFPDGAHIDVVTAVHGFEPSIMGVTIGRKINEQLTIHGLSELPIILPDIYEDRLPGILRDEFPDYQHLIFLSKKLGSILGKTTYEPSNHPGHIHEVVLYQSAVQEELRVMTRRPFCVTSLDGKSERVILPEQKRVEINTGANVTMAEEGKRQAHSVFPVRFSDLVRLIQRVSDVRKHYASEDLPIALKKALVLEEHMLTTQLTEPHTMKTFDWFNPDNTIMVPPQKEVRIPPDDLPEDIEKAIYINVSGSDEGYNITRGVARDLRGMGFAIFAPRHLQWDFRIPTNTRSLYSNNSQGEKVVKAGLARSGGGTVWDMVVSGTPMMYLAFVPYGNPEILANNLTLFEEGIAVEFSRDIHVVDQAIERREQVVLYREGIYKRHNIPSHMSGPEYAAHNIIEAEIAAA